MSNFEDNWMDKEWRGWPRSAWIALLGMVLIILEVIAIFVL